MGTGVIFIFFNFAFCKTAGTELDLNASKRSVEFKNGTLIREVTATIVYSMHQTLVNTTVIVDGVSIPTETMTERITFIQTILPYLKAYISTPSVSPAINTPVATQPFKIIIMNPGILIGCTFGLLFIIGFLYTSCCRRTHSIKRPRARITRKGDSSSSDSFKKAKTNKNKNRSDQGANPSKSGGTKGVSFGVDNSNTLGMVGHGKRRSSRM